jgi:hypothetical protein
MEQPQVREPRNRRERRHPELIEAPEYMTPVETAEVMRTTENKLAQDRYLERGLPFIKVGRKILYARADVVAYLAAGRTDPQREVSV